MPKCENCKFFREARRENAPAIRLHALSNSAYREVYAELERITSEEYGREKDERTFQQRSFQTAANFLNDDQFDFFSFQLPQDRREEFVANVKGRVPAQFLVPPVTLSHCAVHGCHGIYYIPEIQNWGETCGLFKPRRKVPDCHTCRFYTSTDSEQNDLADGDALIGSIQNHDPSAQRVLEGRASEIRGGTGPGIADNLRIAYNSEGKLQFRLPYLPYCESPCPICGGTREAHMCSTCGGTGTQKAQPEIFNRYLSCEAFESREPRRMSSCANSEGVADPLIPDSAPLFRQPSRNQQKVSIVSSMGLSPFGPPQQEGGSPGVVNTVASQLVGMVFDKLREARSTMGGPPAPARDASEISADRIEILVPGQPPLTNEMLRRSVAVVSELFGGKMPGTAQSEYSAFVGNVWRTNNADAFRLQLQLISMYNRDRSDARWRAETSAVFNSLVVLVKKGGLVESRPPQSASPQAADSVQHIVPRDRQCVCGYSNTDSRIFCQQCGKPLTS